MTTRLCITWYSTPSCHLSNRGSRNNYQFIYFRVCICYILLSPPPNVNKHQVVEPYVTSNTCSYISQPKEIRVSFPHSTRWAALYESGDKRLIYGIMKSKKRPKEFSSFGEIPRGHPWVDLLTNSYLWISALCKKTGTSLKSTPYLWLTSTLFRPPPAIFPTFRIPALPPSP